MKKYFSFIFLTLVFQSVYSQDTSLVVVDVTENLSQSKNSSAQDLEVYKLKPAIDIPLTGVFTGLSLVGFTKIYDKENSTEAEINALRKADINSFDRPAAGNYDEDADKLSDGLFYASMPMPVLLLLDKDIRKDAAKIGLLYVEALSITGVIYTGTNYVVNRYRPFVYNDEVPMIDRINGNSTNSFIGGHPAMVATSMFFIAKVYGDYHPESGFRHVLYGAAAAGTVGTALLRLKAGKHFPSDLLAGMAVGTLSGILVPHFHKNKLIKNDRVSVVPFKNRYSSGLALTYKL